MHAFLDKRDSKPEIRTTTTANLGKTSEWIGFIHLLIIDEQSWKKWLLKVWKNNKAFFEADPDADFFHEPHFLAEPRSTKQCLIDSDADI